MPTYYVSSVDGNDSDDGSTWSLAKATFGAAVTAATSNGDIILVSHVHQEELAADTTYTFAADVRVISVNRSSSDAPTAMGTGGWIGNSTTNRGITITGGYDLYFYGVTFRVSGSSSDNIAIGNATGADYTMESCKLWIGNTASGCRILFGVDSATNEAALSLINCTFRFGHVDQGLVLNDGALYLAGCDISTSGTTPSHFVINSGAHGKALFEGCDVSNVGTAFTPNHSNGHKLLILRQCKIPGTLVAPQTTYANRSQVEVYAYDCSDGDNHYQMIYDNGIGTLTVDAGVYANAGAEYNAAASKASWKITTTASASFVNPFITPWISVYNESTSLTPYLEALRSGSTTKYKESELWSDWMYKDYTNSTRAVIDRADRGAVWPASTTDQAASSLGASDWTGEHASSNAYMKLSPGTITPTKHGHISARVCVGAASVSDLYVSPKILGLS